MIAWSCVIIKRYTGRSTNKQQAANAMNYKTLIENRVSLEERLLPMVKHGCNSYSDKYLQYNKKCNTKQCRSKHFLLISHVLPSVLVPHLTIYLLTATNTKGFWPVKWDSTNSFNNKYLPIMPQRFHLPHHHVLKLLCEEVQLSLQAELACFLYTQEPLPLKYRLKA